MAQQDARLGIALPEEAIVKMNRDDLMAIHSVLNAAEALDEIFGENPERSRWSQQLGDLRRRFKAAQAVAQETAAAS